MKSAQLKSWLHKAAAQYGFQQVAISSATFEMPIAERLAHFIEHDYHGEMRWLADTQNRRSAPTHMWENAKTAIILACNYGPDTDPLLQSENKDIGNISVYARGRDYHDVLKGRLKQIASQLASKSSWGVKVFVDTAPLMEKPLAAQAGIGWQGKHTNLVSREFGSWLFLGVILTDGELPVDAPSQDHCGHCTACMDICPTQAFPAPYQLDARKCISYLTIEFKGHIPHHFRKQIGNRIFGCDDCLAVCPWNKFAQHTQEIKFSLGADSKNYQLDYLLQLDETEFRAIFAGSPVKRAGYVSFMRNVLIAAGNAENPKLVQWINSHLTSDSPYIRAMAVWALSCYLKADQLGQMMPADEQDRNVQEEWKQALYHRE